MALVLLAAVLIMSTAQGQEIELQVDECGPDAQQECSGYSETIAPEPAPTSAPPPEEPAGETHDYNLSSGEGTVRSGDEVHKETLEVDSTADADQHEEEAGEHEDGHDDEHGDLEPLLNDDAGLQTVSTNGGSAFAGFGADFLSGDEALARFAVPPFLIPIYVAAGRAYNVPWNVLAAINQIETDFGRIRRQVSYAGALGWMQFMPGTWRAYGVDASGDGVADPFNPVDAIYAAARYLRASGAPDNLRRAVFAYNHADWYVDRVLRTASIYGSLPSGLVAETGSLAFGRFPLVGRVTYGDDFRRAQAAGDRPEGLWIEGRPGASAVATQNVEVVKILLDRKLARAFQRSGTVSASRVVVKVLVTASAGKQARASRAVAPSRQSRRDNGLPKGYGVAPVPGVGVVVEDVLGNRYSYTGLDRLARKIGLGAEVEGGFSLGQIAAEGDSRMLFSVEAAGGARVDPRPLVDGYRLQEVADFYNAVAPLGGNPFVLADGKSIEGVSGSKSELVSRVLSTPGIDIYPAGRQDIASGVIDKRILGTLLYLHRNGLDLTVTSLRSGHSFYTAGGSVSAHSFGAAVDIAAFNGQPVIGHQGPGSLTEQAVKLLMRLEGEAQPAQLISLMNLGGPSFAMGDHHDHLHVGYRFEPSLGSGRSGGVLGSVDFAGGPGAGIFSKAPVSRQHEEKLSRKLGGIENPEVSRRRGAGSLHVEAESPSEADAAEELARKRRGPVVTQPAAAGAQVIDIDIPASGEAWSIGTADGGGRDGWAERQTVLSRFSTGTWRIVGPVRDARGRVANPRLQALATVPGGRGYAVGDRGAVVELRGDRPPRLLTSPIKSRLDAVDVRRAGRGVEGFAAGSDGVAAKLSGRWVTREGAGKSDISSVLLEGDGALAGSDDSGLLRRSAGGWASDDTDFGLAEGLAGRVTAIARGGDALWVVGGVSDSEGQGAAELPFAARLAGGEWHTFCAGRPELASVRELGTPTARQVCDGDLTSDPSNTGAATDVAVTDRGVVVSTSRGLQLHTADGFQPVGYEPAGYERLALSPDARGWALGAEGELTYIRPAELLEDDGVEKLPLVGGGQLVGIEASADGEQLIALASGEAAVLDDGQWETLEGSSVGLRTAAFSDGTVWATDETGALLQLEDGEWQPWEEADAFDRAIRQSVAEALGAEALSVGSDGHSSNGVNAFAFAPNGEGYGVSSSGLVIHYSGGQWRLEETPAAVALNAVAATDDIAVAVGDQGVVVEDSGDGWTAPEDARQLAGDRRFTAIDALADGAVVAAAGGMLLERSTDGDWAASSIQPLGVPVKRLAGYRVGDELRAVALVGEGEELALLQGSSDGWSTLDVPAGLRVADFALREDSNRLALVGYRDGAPVTFSAEVSSR